MPEFTLSPNAYGRVAGGQEGSGQAQIFQPYDAAKFDRQAVELEKQKQKAEKEKKANKVFEPDEVAIGIPTATVTKITEDAQGNKIEQGVQLLTVTSELEKEGTEIWKEGLELNPKSPTYDEDYVNYAKKYADWEYRRRKHENLAATTVENAKLQDKDIAILNGDRKLDVQAGKTAETLDMLNKMPADKALEYRRSNPTIFWKSSYNFPQHQAAMLKNVEAKFMEGYGYPTALVKDEVSGKWTYITEKGKRIDYDEAKKGFKTSYQFTVDGDDDLYNLLLTYEPDPNVLNANGSPATLSDMAIASGVPTLDRKAFAGYVWDKVPAISDMYMPMGDKVRTLSVVGENAGAGDTYINVNANVAPSSVTADSATETGGFNTSLTVFGGGSYAISGASVMSKEDIEKQGGNTSFQATEADIGGTLKTNINIPIAAGTNIIVYQAAAIKDELPDYVLRSLGASKNRQLSDKQVDMALKNGHAKFLKFLPYAQITGTYEGSSATGRNTLNNVGSIVSQEKKNAYQTAATEMSKDFWNTLGNNYAKYPSMHNGGWRYAATLYQTHYSKGYNAQKIFTDLDSEVRNGLQLEQAYNKLNIQYGGSNTNQTEGNNQPTQGTSR
jgi:hypothetical protein